MKDLADPGINKYKKIRITITNCGLKSARVSMSVFEDNTKQVNQTDFIALRRQRITAIVLSQVYVAWAQYMSAVEDYEINMEIANTSENIAEDVTIQNGSFAEKASLKPPAPLTTKPRLSWLMPMFRTLWAIFMLLWGWMHCLIIC